MPYAVTRIRTWVIAATTRGTNHYTITAATRLRLRHASPRVDAIHQHCRRATRRDAGRRRPSARTRQDRPARATQMHCRQARAFAK